MSFSLSVQQSPRVAHLWFSGSVSTRTLLEACARLVVSPEWRPGTPMIWDFSDVQEVHLSPNCRSLLVESSARAQDRIGASPSAAVVKDERLHDLLEGYAHAFETTDRPFFKSESRWEAVTWLFDVDAQRSLAPEAAV